MMKVPDPQNGSIKHCDVDDELLLCKYFDHPNEYKNAYAISSRNAALPNSSLHPLLCNGDNDVSIDI